jgi:hypothetical protein
MIDVNPLLLSTYIYSSILRASFSTSAKQFAKSTTSLTLLTQRNRGRRYSFGDRIDVPSCSTVPDNAVTYRQDVQTLHEAASPGP